MPENKKSKALSTRLKKEDLLDFEEYKEKKEDKTGQEPGNSETLRELAKIGLKSTVGEGTPTERELRRDIEHLENEVERLEQEKEDLREYLAPAAAMALGFIILTTGAMVQTQTAIGDGIIEPVLGIGFLLTLIAAALFVTKPISDWRRSE